MAKITEKQLSFLKEEIKKGNLLFTEESFRLYLEGKNPFKNRKRIFYYKNFFYNKKFLHVWDYEKLESLVGTINEGQTFKSIENVKVSLTLKKNYKKEEIINFLGGEEKILKKTISMDQIQILIEKQKYGHKNGILCVDGHSNIFFTKTFKNDLIKLRLAFHNKKWSIFFCEEEFFSKGSQILQIISN